MTEMTKGNNKKKILWFWDPSLTLYVSIRDGYQERLERAQSSIFRNIFKKYYDEKIEDLQQSILCYSAVIDGLVAKIEEEQNVIVLRSDGMKTI